MLVKDIDLNFHGGLNRITDLGIERKGVNHQARSDSIVTIGDFHKLIEIKSINKEKIKK